MLTMRKRLSFPFLLLVTGLLAAFAPATPASAASPNCRLPLSVKLNSHDPTELLEGSQAWVYVNKGARVSGAKVTVKRAGKTFAKGRITGRLAGGRTAVVKLYRKKLISRGKYRVTVTARKAGCNKRRGKARSWTFGVPSLPVKALPYSTKVNDNVGVVRFALRPIRRAKVGTVRATLVNSSGATVAEDLIPELGSDQVVAELPINSKLTPGKYSVKLVGKEAESEIWRRSDHEVRFVSGGGAAAPVDPTGMQVQKVAVDWNGGKWQGRQFGGFIAPGIGFGEIVCSPDQQWIRFYPSNGGREAAMMTWTDKDWGSFSEVALREAKYANGTGPDFREGLNKFTPTEKWSRGSYQGIISDRGPIEGPGGVSLVPPTTYDLDWEWNFSDSGKAKCHVEAIFRTETDLPEKPLARSTQIVWRGESNATPENTFSSVDFPDLGDVTLTAEAGPTGVRRLMIDSPVGGRVDTREGSDVESVVFEQGPITARLTNNGMLFVQLNSGERIMVTSRWKVNDPAPEGNWAVIAAQVYSP
jgi:hypothetical protein